ncbi:ankyrin repeat domain-containing protein 37 isoform X2 [Sorex araneus]|uniref:ankyrin repeat domain-containing protein 37 isoform X2 n=1 Tax=Sorex araneus TaxID=42254 RepID=UPI002433A124|nr:ankyrin repeat domain-containing protein 37 isoform X2 [Sorex araneus]
MLQPPGGEAPQAWVRLLGVAKVGVRRREAGPLGLAVLKFFHFSLGPCTLTCVSQQRATLRAALARIAGFCSKWKMQLLDCNPEVDGLKHLLEIGTSVNAPPDLYQQSPVHLAAGGGLPCFILWQLQMGADLNQQDAVGEAPIHKAAKVGSLECLSLLVAGDAQINLCNKNGQTAEDLAWSYGFPECAKFLTAIKCMQAIKSSERDHCVPVLRQKRSLGSAENIYGKRKCW